MKKYFTIVAAFAVLIFFFIGVAIGQAQTIGIEPVVTIKVVGTAPITGLSGLTIQAAGPAALTVTCNPQGRAVESCNNPAVSQYKFDDFSDLIQSNDPIDGFGVFQFTGPSGVHDIIFSVLNADDDSGDPIIYSEIVTQITIP